jgi:hypothetical protein
MFETKANSEKTLGDSSLDDTLDICDHVVS